MSVDNRLVKVALPAKLVQSMDRVITASSAYSGRQDFISDAVANLLADIEATSDPGPGHGEPADPASAADQRAWTADAPTSVETPGAPRLARDEAVRLASIQLLSADLPVADNPAAPNVSREPTWGLHNRDWPTLWSASLLGEASRGGPVEYDKWLAETSQRAWLLADALGDHLDLSGLPRNREKPERSETRFVEFFIGSAPGRGPLFDFGLAQASSDGRVLLTAPGLTLLRRIEGMPPTTSQPPEAEWRRAFLEHLTTYRQADLHMFGEVIDLIAAGASTRVELNQAVCDRHPDWSETNAATNAAGYVARAREWGLLERKQINHRYVIRGEAIVDLKAALDGPRTETVEEVPA